VPSKKLLLVDTNVISHALSPNQINCYIELFKSLESEYRFIITGFTKYELLRTSDKSHKQEIEDYLTQNMATVDLSDVLINFSSRVYYLYVKHPGLNIRLSDGDVINAAFAMAKDCPILTIDNTDYPRMLFAEKSRHKVVYTSKRSKEVNDTLYLLVPDMDKIRECFEEYQA
jgi:predicted nucleic acid-binding protein